MYSNFLWKFKTEAEFLKDNISQELLMTKDKLLAAEQCKELLRSQLDVIIYIQFKYII